MKTVVLTNKSKEALVVWVSPPDNVLGVTCAGNTYYEIEPMKNVEISSEKGTIHVFIITKVMTMSFSRKENMISSVLYNKDYWNGLIPVDGEILIDFDNKKLYSVKQNDHFLVPSVPINRDKCGTTIVGRYFWTIIFLIILITIVLLYLIFYKK